MKSFEELRVWQESHKLVLMVYKETKKFPKEELFGLVSQLRRSVSSIPANIAEGFSRKSINEYIQFLFQARGSLSESKYHLILAKDLGYLETTVYQKLVNQCDLVGKLLNALINSLKKK